jgi:hypothetical protein
MRYSDVDTSYLYTATQRIAAGLKSATTLQTFIYGNPDPKPSAPFWAVDVVNFEQQDEASNLHVQIWTVRSYLVYEPPPQDRAESVYPTIWRALPQAYVYMQSHKSLIFDETHTSPPYLAVDRVEVTLERINEVEIGFTIVHRLPFRLTLQQEH